MSLKQLIKKTIIYRVYVKVKYMLYPITLTKAKINKTVPTVPLEKNDNNEGGQLIVALTSFPERISYVHKTLYSLFNQDYKPNVIILSLATTQFPNLENDLPREIIELQELGLKIEWVDEDIRSYKKLVPIIERYPNDIIVTADDDLYYPSYWLKALIESYNTNPDEIHCHLVTRLKKDEKHVRNVQKRDEYIDTASFNNKILGGSGTLYPRGALHKDVLKREVFLELAPTSDDVWFWAMALRNGTKIRWIKGTMKRLYYVEYSQEQTECLCKINDGSEGLFLKHINDIAERYDLYDLIE